jgi:phospholipase/carboxylesterase
MQPIDGIERETGADIGLSVIWLHGLGADAGDFLPLVDALSLPIATRFIFPNAPVRPVTINGGMRMRAWYDIIGFGPDAPEDVAGLAASATLVRDLVAREVERGMPVSKVLLAGFSQGGAVVQHAGLGATEPVGGIIGLSTYLPAFESLLSAGSIRTDVPVWIAHGSHDAIIPLHRARHSAQQLRNSGVDVEWSLYPMGHEVCPPEIADLNAWLNRQAAR